MNASRPHGALSRRAFMKGSALAGLGTLTAGTGLGLYGCADGKKGEPLGGAETVAEDKVVWGHCSPNCYGRCALRLHVKDNEVFWVETDNNGGDAYGNHQLRACLRGRSLRRILNHPDRLNWPMKRVGKRGEGKFEQIGWDEALQIIADNYTRIRDQYGPGAIYRHGATGVQATNIGGFLTRFLNINGGFLNNYGGYSAAQSKEAIPYTWGKRTNNYTSDIANTKLLVMFGENSAVTKMGGAGAHFHIKQGLEKSGARCIVVDPRYSDSVADLADEWIPIRPGTDAALVDAMAYVMITENLVDQDFLDKYCVGYDERTMPEGLGYEQSYKARILGDGPDGVARTPAWAAKITLVPEQRIVELAREIATTKPCFILQGLGPQRQANGEQTSRAIMMLSILTGNPGKAGGGTGAFHGQFSIETMSVPSPVKNSVKAQIPTALYAEGILRGSKMTATADGIQGADKLPSDIKCIFNYGGNSLTNQHVNINKTKEILADEAKCEFIVVWDVFMTDSAKYADILLPDLMPVEQPSYVGSEYNGNMSYGILGQACTEPKFERRTLYSSLAGLSELLGTSDAFTEGRDEEQWLRVLYDKMREKDSKLPTYDDMLARGVYRRSKDNAKGIAFASFFEDPEAHPLDTESGKVEIYSSKLAKIAETWTLPVGDVIDPLPVYAPCPEGYDDPAAKRYPLQMFGFHHKARTHSSWGNIEILQKAARQCVWINPQDAAARNISDGDVVKVFNDRGCVKIEAKVTKRIMPGVVGMGEGAWFQADEEGNDVGGCVNTLTSSHPSPLAKGASMHTNLVEVTVA